MAISFTTPVRVCNVPSYPRLHIQSSTQVCVCVYVCVRGRHGFCMRARACVFVYMCACAYVCGCVYVRAIE
jgi:hypothetical protein